VIQSPRAPSPCSTIVSIAWRAEARSVTASSSGHSKMSVTAAVTKITKAAKLFLLDRFRPFATQLRVVLR